METKAVKDKMWNKSVVSWVLYDCANSAFYTTVMAGFFPIFFKKYWSMGADVALSTQRLGWILAISGFLLAIMSPILGVISDKKKYKKILLFVFMLMGALSTFSLAFIPQGQWFPAAVLYGFALLCCTGSTVFYDSLLVSVTKPRFYDMVSSLGFGFGYLAGGVLFSVNVLMYLKPELFGLESATAAILVSFMTVAVWWFLLTIPIMMNVEEPSHNISSEKLSVLLKNCFSQLAVTFSKIRQNRNLMYFLLAYWFYIDGVATMMGMAVDFGVSINLDSGSLIKALILTQAVGFPAAYLSGTLAHRFGPKAVISVGVMIYIGVVLSATQMRSETHFYAMAGLIGLAQGTIQALSRSLFAQLIPAHNAGEYFGFYNLLGKFASVLGPLLMAVFMMYFHDVRKAILSLLILFCFGLYFLLKVKVKRDHSSAA